MRVYLYSGNQKYFADRNQNSFADRFLVGSVNPYCEEAIGGRSSSLHREGSPESSRKLTVFGTEELSLARVLFDKWIDSNNGLYYEGVPLSDVKFSQDSDASDVWTVELDYSGTTDDDENNEKEDAIGTCVAFNMNVSSETIVCTESLETVESKLCVRQARVISGGDSSSSSSGSSSSSETSSDVVYETNLDEEGNVDPTKPNVVYYRPYLIDFKRGIEKSNEGFQGTERKVSAASVQMTVKIPLWKFTSNYVRLLLSKTNCVNNDYVWGIFAPGELMFDGYNLSTGSGSDMSNASGSDNGSSEGGDGSSENERLLSVYSNKYYVEVAFNFSCRPNVVRDYFEAKDVLKKGWEHLWIYRMKTTSGKRVDVVPWQVNVERLYEECSFEEFRLPKPNAISFNENGVFDY